MISKPQIFLDFDGVICDSINECFVSSWKAYRSGASSISISDYLKFRRYRPFIRRGGDYVMLQRCIDHGIDLSSQADFDREASALGNAAMDEFHRIFYAAREAVLADTRQYWLSLNTLYPTVYSALRGMMGQPVVDRLWILTTKKVDFAYEIAAANGLNWRKDRIICSGKEKKIEVIGGVIGDSDTAKFVDDQIDHFFPEADSRIKSYLASWGYVLPEWLDRGVTVIDQEELGRLLLEWAG